MLFFSLVLQAFLSVSLHPVSVWSCFLGLLSFRSAVGPGSLIPFRCLPFRCLVTGPVWSQGFFYLSMLGPQHPSVVLRCLPSVRRSYLGYGPTCSLSVLRLFGPFLEALLSAPSSLSASGPLGSPFQSVAVSCGLLFSAGSEFLPSLHDWSVGFSRGFAALASLRGHGSSSPGCPCSMPLGCLCSAPFLPLLFLRRLCGLVVVVSPG